MPAAPPEVQGSAAPRTLPTALPDGERIDYVTIVTPNDAHAAPAEAAANALVPADE